VACTASDREHRFAEAQALAGHSAEVFDRQHVPVRAANARVLRPKASKSWTSLHAHSRRRKGRCRISMGFTHPGSPIKRFIPLDDFRNSLEKTRKPRALT
jgi:hypothetical protein